MKVRTKLIIGFTVIAFFLWVIALFAGNNFGNLNEKYAAIEQDILPGMLAMNELNEVASDAYYSIMKYILHDDVVAKEDASSLLTQLQVIETYYSPYIKTDIPEFTSNQIMMEKIADFYFSAGILMDYKRRGASYDELLIMDRNTSLPALLALQKEVNERKVQYTTELALVKSDINNSYYTSVHSLYLSAGIVSILAALAALLTTRSIVRPLSTLRKGTAMIARGNLNYKVGTKANDEIGQLSRAFDHMTQSLSTSMTSIENLNKEITERKQAEEALQESEEKFSKAFRNSPNSMSITTIEDGVFLDVNNSFTRDMGYTREEVIGHHSRQLNLWVNPKERDRIMKILRKEGTVTDEEYSTRIKSGEVRTMLFSAEPINVGGESCVIAVTTDISERKKTEQLQRDENHVLTLLGQGSELNEILDAIVRTGEAHDPAIKGSVLLFDSSKGLLIQASGPSLPPVYTDLLKGGLPPGPNMGSCGTAAYLKERVIVPDIMNSPLFKPHKEAVETATSNNLLAVWSQPIISSDGEVLGTIANYSNKVGEPDEDDLKVLEWSARIAAIAIERKRDEEALSNEATRRRILIEQSRDGIVVVDDKGIVYEANQRFAEMLGYSMEEVSQLGIWDWEAALPRDLVAEMIQSVDETGDHFETKHVRKNGSVFDVGISTNAAVFHGQKLIFCVCRDITERKKAEEALRKSEERYRDLFDNAREFIQSITPDGHFIYVNQAWKNALGYSDEEIASLQVWDIIHSDALPHCQDVFQKLMSGESFDSVETTFVAKNGRLIEVEGDMTIQNDGDKVVATRGIFRDITERKQAEEALRESEEKFSKAFRSSPEAIAITTIEGGKFLEVNDSFSRITGYTRNDVIGRTSAEINIWGNALDRARMKDILNEQGKVYNEEFEFRIKSGEIRNWMFSAEKIIIHGKECLLSITTDITERKQAEEALRKNEERFRLLTDYSTDLISRIKVGPPITTDYISPSCFRITGYKPEEFYSDPDLGLHMIHPDDREFFIKNTSPDKKNSPKTITLRLVRKDGQQIWIEQSNVTIYNDNGEPVAIHLIARDITERKHAEEELRLLGSITQQVSDATTVFSLDNKILYMNRAAQEMFGYKPEEILGNHLNTFNSQPASEEILDEMLGLVKSGKRWVGIIEKKRKDGSHFMCECNVSPLYDEEGQVISYIDVQHDVTRKLQIEEALRFSDAAFKSIHESVIAVDTELTITHWNKISEQMFGIKASEAIGKKFSDVIEVIEEYPGQMEKRLKILKTRGYHKEEQLYRVNSKEIWVDTHVQEIVAAGKRYGRVVLATDITERKKMETAIKDSEEKFSKAFQASPESIAIVNVSDGNFVEVNESYTRITGYSRDEVLGHNANHFNMWADPEQQKSMLEKIKNDIKIDNEEFAFRTKSGEIRTMLFSNEHIQLGGKPCLLTVSTDITERKQAEEELKQASARLAATNKELEAFSYSVSHDLRSPLRSIDGFSQALLEDYNDILDANGRDYLQRLRGASQKMGELIDGILKLSRLTRNEMRQEDVNLSNLAEEITNRLRETQPKRNVKFTINKGLTASGDPQLLRVLFENLLGNAWKFSGKNPQAKIEFGTIPNGGKPTFFIKDNGAGFDMTYNDKLFGAFQRLHDSSDFPGTGIGLATVQRIINRHGGNIWAESAVGKGATFYFTLN